MKINLHKLRKFGALKPRCKLHWVRVPRHTTTLIPGMRTGPGERELIRVETIPTPRINIVEMEEDTVMLPASMPPIAYEICESSGYSDEVDPRYLPVAWRGGDRRHYHGH